jgi:hypothetical protein
MSVTVTLIIGVALIHLLVFGHGDDQVAESTLTTLVGVVATMMGFYFGGRTAQQQAQGNALPLATPSTAQLSSIQPPTSKAGGPVAAMGKGFGTTHDEVRVGAQPASLPIVSPYANRSFLSANPAPEARLRLTIDTGRLAQHFH